MLGSDKCFTVHNPGHAGEAAVEVFINQSKADVTPDANTNADEITMPNTSNTPSCPN